MRAILVAGLALAMAGPAMSAASDPVTRPDPLGDPRRSQMLEAFLAGTPDSNDLGNGGGVTAQTLAIVGREDLVTSMPIFRGYGRRVCKPLTENGVAVDPVSYIAKRAAGVRVTMVNEAHDMPQGRAFNAAIAAALRPEGYALYSGETFKDGIGATRPAWPLLTDGYFADEPIYGRLIRSLRRLGYQLFAYEFYGPFDPALSWENQTNRREAAQAANLEARLKSTPERDKLLVHVGYAHLNKKLSDIPVKMMAQRFVETTGIEPLTVDQTSFWSDTGSYTVCDQSNWPVSLADIYVGVPKPAFERGRPRWRLEQGDQFVEIPAVLRRAGEAAIYEARYAAEPDTAVPVERLLVRPDEDLQLLMPPGRYRLSVWTQKNGWSASMPLVVDGPHDKP
jgi:hypothetical protein